MILLLAFPIRHAWCAVAPWHNIVEKKRGAALSKMECAVCGCLWAMSRETHRFGSVLPWDADFEGLSTNWPAPQPSTTEKP